MREVRTTSIKANDKIKVHLYDTSNREIQTRHINTVFTVYEKNGKLGIDWNQKEVNTPAKVMFLHLLKHLQILLFLRMWKQEKIIILVI